MTREKTERYASVWDALADTPQEAENLRVRSELTGKITALVAETTGSRPRRPAVAE